MHFPYVKSNILRNLSNILCKPYVLTFTCHSPPTTLPTTPPFGRYCGLGSRTNLFGYWRLVRGQRNRQLIGGVSQRVNIKRGHSIFLSPDVLHPWQADPPLPSLVEIELSNHYTQRLPTSTDGTFLNAMMLEYSCLTLGIVWSDWMQPTIRCYVLCVTSQRPQLRDFLLQYSHPASHNKQQTSNNTFHWFIIC